MRIYFTAAISQKDKFGIYYERINRVLVEAGHRVKSGNLFDMSERSIADETEDERMKWYQQSLKNIAKADLVVVEISFPSTVNVGHELSVALERGKPVLALYLDECDPIFLRGMEEEKLFIIGYNSSNLEEMVKDGLEYVADVSDTRFNFFISPKHQRYLDWIARVRKVPRAVYLRRLIEEDMKGNKDYS